jgi:NitT/TauT family transport system permease protein
MTIGNPSVDSRTDPPPFPVGAARSRSFRYWLRLVATHSVTLAVLAFLLMLVVWQLVIAVFKVPQYVLPSIPQIWDALTQQWGPLWEGTRTTLYETVIGFLIAAVAGVGIGVAVAFSSIARKMLYPLVLGANAVPKIALAPVFLIWFGFGQLPKDMIAALVAFFPIVISTTQGLREIDPDMLHVARVSRASALLMFWKIRLPLSVPSLFSGFKVGISLALTGAVVGEFVAGNAGLGYIAYNAESVQDTALAFAAIFLLVILSLVVFYAVELAELLIRRSR